MLEKHNNTNFYTGTIEGQINTYCNQVKAGSKPLAFMNLQSRYIDTVIEYVKNLDLNIYTEDLQNDNAWKCIYIYKYDYLIDIIKSLPNNPQTAYEHWVIGKACGYSDDAIGEFIKVKQMGISDYNGCSD